MFAALERQGLAGEPVVWVEELADVVRAQLMAVDAVLIWVNPVTEDTGEDRRTLDAVLREVAASGILVCGHPNVIDRRAPRRCWSGRGRWAGVRTRTYTRATLP